jgi:hypothetical protein
VINEIGPYGGVFSRPSVWPGNGGYVYIVTGSPGQSGDGSTGWLNVYSYGIDGLGKPALTAAATSSDAFGFGSSSPIVTSNGVTSGSALVWVIFMADVSGVNAQLRAYDPVPVGGVPTLRFSAPIGVGNKFTPPDAAFGRIYVGARDGHIRMFGPPLLNLSVGKNRTTGAVHLVWSGGNPPYTLQRAESADFTLNATTLVNQQSVTSYDDPVLNDGKDYFYRVR